jgi:hypothetical protein
MGYQRRFRNYAGVLVEWVGNRFRPKPIESGPANRAIDAEYAQALSQGLDFEVHHGLPSHAEMAAINDNQGMAQ